MLLFKIREAGFSVILTESKDDYTEFVEHFYVKLLQSKALHINDNNKWKVIVIGYENDIFSETVEKMFERNNFTDRKINLAYESSLISELKQDKTTLLKIYQTFHFAYKFNYLFCLDLYSYEPQVMLDQISKINHLFLDLVESKKVPIYFLLGLDQEQMEIMEDHLPVLFKKNDIEFVFKLPKLKPEEIRDILDEYPIYNQSKKEIQNEIVDNIYQSDNTLLQLKNAISKFKAGIVPKKDLVIGITSSDERQAQPKKVKATRTVESTQLKNIYEAELDSLYNKLGTRFQRETLCKILLKMMVVEDDGKAYANDCLYQSITENLHILEKDISNALRPFVEKKIISFDPDRDDSIRILKPNAFATWPMFRQMMDKSRSYDLIFEIINQMYDPSDIDLINSLLNQEQLMLINSDDTEFFVNLKASQFKELDDKVSIIRSLAIEVPDGKEVASEPPKANTSPRIKINTDRESTPVPNKNLLITIKKSISESEDISANPEEQPILETEDAAVDQYIEIISDEGFSESGNQDFMDESRDNKLPDEVPESSSILDNAPEPVMNDTENQEPEQVVSYHQASTMDQEIHNVESPEERKSQEVMPDEAGDQLIENIIDEGWSETEDQDFTDKFEDDNIPDEVHASSSTMDIAPEPVMNDAENKEPEQVASDHPASTVEQDIHAVESQEESRSQEVMPDKPKGISPVSIKLKIGIHRQDEPESSGQKTNIRPTISIKRKE